MASPSYFIVTKLTSQVLYTVVMYLHANIAGKEVIKDVYSVALQNNNITTCNNYFLCYTVHSRLIIYVLLIASLVGSHYSFITDNLLLNFTKV